MLCRMLVGHSSLVYTYSPVNATVIKHLPMKNKVIDKMLKFEGSVLEPIIDEPPIKSDIEMVHLRPHDSIKK